ncbi:MAG TPA: hypothetical protein VNG90_05675 [Candidatus Acidoferrum sp.]|nr:hypothetical protein [Candidatus Acidoferrum sp.]
MKLIASLLFVAAIALFGAAILTRNQVLLIPAALGVVLALLPLLVRTRKVAEPYEFVTLTPKNAEAVAKRLRGFLGNVDLFVDNPSEQSDERVRLVNVEVLVDRQFIRVRLIPKQLIQIAFGVQLVFQEQSVVVRDTNNKLGYLRRFRKA